MIVALRNQKGGAGETTFALRLGGQRARQRKRITLFDADQQGSALVSLEQRAGKRQERLFAVIGLPQDALRRDAPELCRLPTTSSSTARPVSPPCCAPRRLRLTQRKSPHSPRRSMAGPATGVSGRVTETRVFCPTLFARFVLSRRPARSLIAHDAAQSLADHDPQASASRVGQRVIFAEAARSGQLKQRRTAPRRPSSTRDSGARRRDRNACAVTAQERNGGFVARPRDAERRSRPRPQPTPRACGRPGSPWTTGRRSAAASRPQPSSAARPLAWPA